MKKLISIVSVIALLASVSSANATACYGKWCKPPVKVAGSSIGGGSNWWVFVCPVGIVSAAMVANFRNNRELTWNEAATCGLLYWPNM